MRNGLTVDRQPIENEFNRVRFLLEANYLPESVHPDDLAELPYRISEAFSLYLDSVCSHVVGGANIEWIVGEYLHGQCIKLENKGLVLERVHEYFQTAAQPTLSILMSMSAKATEVGEEISEMTYHTIPSSKIGMIMMESEPWD